MRRHRCKPAAVESPRARSESARRDPVPDAAPASKPDFWRLMPEVFFNGPAGRLEGRFHPAKQRGAPIAVVLHSHPQFGGTMNNQIVYNMYYAFAERGFNVLRFNFRGVGRSQGAFDHGQGEISDAASALDWAQSISPEARACWIAGVSFGSWIGMQLLMRRPGNRGLHLDRAAGQPLRLQLPRPLPFVRPVRARRQGPRRAAEGSAGPDREAEDPEGHRDRACGDRQRQPFLRGLHGRTAGDGRSLSRQAARHAPPCADAGAQGSRQARARRRRQRRSDLDSHRDEPEVEAACARMARKDFVTVDTEFHRETTFWPMLCVVQLASEDEALAIDALAPDIDLPPLSRIDGRPERGQSVSRRAAGRRNLLETFGPRAERRCSTPRSRRWCAASASRSPTANSRSRSVKAHIDKSSRFTDWARRPLSDAQIEYAIGDVTHLRDIYRELLAKLNASGRLGWLEDEMRVLTSPATYEQHPERAWERFKTRARKPRDMAVLMEVCAWREHEAQTRDVPRSRVLKDDVLVEVALAAPRTRRGARQFARLSARHGALARRRGDSRRRRARRWRAIPRPCRRSSASARGGNGSARPSNC